MGSAGFEPAASSAQGWHHTKLDNDPEERIALQSIVWHIFLSLCNRTYLYIQSGTDRFLWISLNAIKGQER